MRDHCECQQAMNEAMAEGRNGWAEFIATRCDLTHGHLTDEGETE